MVVSFLSFLGGTFNKLRNESKWSNREKKKQVETKSVNWEEDFSQGLKCSIKEMGKKMVIQEISKRFDVQICVYCWDFFN